MTDCTEVLFVSDSSGQMQTASCFDPHIGTTLMTYKGGGGVPSNSLSILGNDYLISGDSSKPLVHVWPLNSQEPSGNLRMVVAGKVSALSVSPDGLYCIAGIDRKLHIWQTSSGALLNVISKHYQRINKIVFINDSTHFISCCDDGVVLVWQLTDLVQKQTGVFTEHCGTKEPVYSFTQHSLPVTGVHVGAGNMQGRVFTVSTDQTCKIYSLSDGGFLLSIVFDDTLTAILANSQETELYIGTTSGKILQFSLDSYPRNLEYHVEPEKEKIFTGHTKAVTCLSGSLDGRTIASGSDDARVLIWDVPSRQLLRTFEMKGPITNLTFRITSRNLFKNEFTPQLFLSPFKRVSSSDFVIEILTKTELFPASHANDFKRTDAFTMEDDASAAISRLKEENAKLKTINKQLYQFAMEKIVNRPLAFSMNGSE